MKLFLENKGIESKIINEGQISFPDKDYHSNEEFKNDLMLRPKDNQDSDEDIEKEDDDKPKNKEEPEDKHFYADFADVDFNKNSPIKDRSPVSNQTNNKIITETFEKFGLTNVNNSTIPVEVIEEPQNANWFEAPPKTCKESPAAHLLLRLPDYAFLIDPNICFPDGFFGS